MPINEQAARIATPGKGKVQPARGKGNVGIVTVWDGNFSNNYPGEVNCRTSSHINYGDGPCVEYVNQGDMEGDDPRGDLKNVREYH